MAREAPKPYAKSTRYTSHRIPANGPRPALYVRTRSCYGRQCAKSPAAHVEHQESIEAQPPHPISRGVCFCFGILLNRNTKRKQTAPVRLLVSHYICSFRGAFPISTRCAVILVEFTRLVRTHLEYFVVVWMLPNGILCIPTVFATRSRVRSTRWRLTPNRRRGT